MLLPALFIATIFAYARGQEGKWLSPVYENFYEFPLPIPPIKVPLKKFTFANGNAIDYYEIQIRPVELQLYPNLNKTRLVAYDGIAPGPTFHMTQGTEAVVRFVNVAADRANSVHLHGSYSRTPFDGWAEDITEPGQYKDYYYPNRQNARSLWYHDHAVDHTAENAYFGQAGFYIIHDDDELATQGLPQGAYDIPLALAAKRYNGDGTLWDPEANNEDVSVFGDVIHVNGQPWPYFSVEPRRYRFRLLNLSVSRTFQLYFEDSNGRRIAFSVVGSDTGLLMNPVSSTQLDISMAERWEVVFDFTAYSGQNVTVRSNRNVGADEDYDSTDKVMRFVVGNVVTDQTKNEPLPAVLRNVPFPAPKNGVDRSFKFERHQGKWAINDHFWSDGPEARVLAKPARGQTEVWELQNGGGGWSHPVHIHLIDFQILSRSGGPRGEVVLPYEKVALKDVVWLDTGETVRVLARYAPWDGLYMFHCHNLIHEDHAMMAAFNVTALADLGYDEKTRFLDPMEQRYRALPFAPNDLTSRLNDFSDAAVAAKINSFNDLEAYIHVSETDERLKAYWATHLTSNPISTSPGPSTSTTMSTSSTTSTSTASTMSGDGSSTTAVPQTSTSSSTTSRTSSTTSGSNISTTSNSGSSTTSLVSSSSTTPAIPDSGTSTTSWSRTLTASTPISVTTTKSASSEVSDTTPTLTFSPATSVSPTSCPMVSDSTSAIHFTPTTPVTSTSNPGVSSSTSSTVASSSTSTTSGNSPTTWSSTFSTSTTCTTPETKMFSYPGTDIPVWVSSSVSKYKFSNPSSPTKSWGHRPLYWRI